MKRSVVVLPSAEEIRGRFSAAFGPDIECFVSHLLRHEGEVLNSTSLVTMLVEEVYAAAGNSTEFLETLFLLIPDFIDALIDESGVAIRAKAILETFSKATQGH